LTDAEIDSRCQEQFGSPPSNLERPTMTINHQVQIDNQPKVL